MLGAALHLDQRKVSLDARGLPGLPPPPLVPDPPKGRQPPFPCLRRVIEIGTNTIGRELLQLLLLLFKEGGEVLVMPQWQHLTPLWVSSR